MEHKSDLEMAMAALTDEVGGVKEYLEIAEYSTDQELKAIAMNIAADEKKHANILMQFVAKHVQAMLSK